MDRVSSITKESLEAYLLEGKTTKEIGRIFNIGNNTVSWHIRKWNLTHLYKTPRIAPYHLDSIETKEWAYLLGFIIADSSIHNERVEISVALQDLELLQLFSNLLEISYHIDDTLDRKTRRFPRVRLCRTIKGINKFIGNSKKNDRNVPIIRKDLEVYLIRGLFDADGCITWGRRKDRNRVWHKVTFSSSLNILTSIQKVLYKLGISTVVRPKGTEACFILEFANKEDILKFYKYLYEDKEFIPLKRKFLKFEALRLELGEITGTTINSTIVSGAMDLSIEHAETTGELNGTLNNQNSTQGL